MTGSRTARASSIRGLLALFASRADERAREPSVRAETAHGSRDVDPKRARGYLLVIVACALALRVVYVLESRENPWFGDPQMDAAYHVAWARAFAAGLDFQPGPFFRAPLYPWFLGAIFKFCGDGLLFPRLVQALIGSLSCALVYLVAARAFDRRTGLVASACAATYWMLIYFDGELLLPVLEVPAGLCVVWLALRYRDKPTTIQAAWIGVALGIAALVRPNFLVLAPLLLGWLALAFARPLRERSMHVAAFVASLAATIAPVTIYNVAIGHDRVLISSQGGVNLWIGNNPASDGATAIVPGTRGDWWGGFEDTIRLAESAEGRRLLPSEVSSHYTRLALEFWRDQPAKALALLARKVRLFWTDLELGNNQDDRFFALRFGPILRLLPIGFGVLAPLALLGLVLTARRAGALFPVWIFVPAYTASVVAFFVCARYRVPVLPVMMIFAAHASVWCVGAALAHRWRAFVLALAFTAGTGWLVQRVPSDVDRTSSKGLWALGVAAERDLDLERALELYEESIEANARHANAHASLGAVLARLGRATDAEASLRRALALDPGLGVARLALTDLLTDQNRFDEALISARELASSPSTDGPGAYAIGRIAFARAARAQAPAVVSTLRAEARVAFERALERASTAVDRFNAAFGIGEVDAASGLFERALSRYDEALRAISAPDEFGRFWLAHKRRLQTLLDLGRREEAVSSARELRARYAGDPRAIEATRAVLWD